METTNSLIDYSMYAGFWKRFVAHLIDSLIILIPLLTILTIIRNNGNALDENERNTFAVIVGWLYYAISESSGAQATIGKKIMKIKVTDINGNRIKFGKATGRFFGKFISAIILLMGFIMVAFTEKRQGLHDIMSGCLVTNRILPHAVINFEPSNVSVFVAGGSGEQSELVRTPEEYNAECKQELVKVFPDIRFILEETGFLVGMPSATLVYSYAAKNGNIREKQINLFGQSVTYRLLAELPEDQIESTGKYFEEIVANFKPVTG